MRLSHFAPAALPFLLLLALLVTLILSPRIHSNPLAQSSPNPATSYIPTLAPIQVTALDSEEASPATEANDFVSVTGTVIRSNWPWMHSELWMPYFSFGTPAVSSRRL